MSERYPSHASIKTDSGERVVPIEAWLAESESQKIQELSRDQVQFLKDGKPIPIREALIAMKAP